MHIITTDIVKSEHDAFWADISGVTGDMPRRPVLVITNKTEGDTSPQIRKMLEACKLSADQYNIIYLGEDEQVAWHQLKSKLNPAVVFLIGVLPARLGVSALFRLHEPNRFNDTIWLPAMSVAELDQHADAKKQLWTQGMKPIFVDRSYGDIA